MEKMFISLKDVLDKTWWDKIEMLEMFDRSDRAKPNLCLKDFYGIRVTTESDSPLRPYILHKYRFPWKIYKNTHTFVLMHSQPFDAIAKFSLANHSFCALDFSNDWIPVKHTNNFNNRTVRKISVN
jgi:hypothetical protein